MAIEETKTQTGGDPLERTTAEIYEDTLHQIAITLTHIDVDNMSHAENDIVKTLEYAGIVRFDKHNNHYISSFVD